MSEQIRQLWQAPSNNKDQQALEGLAVDTATNLRAEYYQLIEMSITEYTTAHASRYQPSELEIFDTIARLTTLSRRIATDHPEEFHRLLQADYRLGYRVLTAQGRLNSGLAQHFSAGIHENEKNSLPTTN